MDDRMELICYFEREEKTITKNVMNAVTDIQINDLSETKTKQTKNLKKNHFSASLRYLVF